MPNTLSYTSSAAAEPAAALAGCREMLLLCYRGLEPEGMDSGTCAAVRQYMSACQDTVLLQHIWV